MKPQSLAGQNSLLAYLNKTLQRIFYAQFFLALPIYLYFALKPSSDSGGLFIPPEVLHVLGNLLLTLSSRMALRDKLSMAKMIIGLIILSTCVEGLQHFSPGRVFDFYDILANFLGIIIGVCVILISQWLSKKIAVSMAQ